MIIRFLYLIQCKYILKIKKLIKCKKKKNYFLRDKNKDNPK